MFQNDRRSPITVFLLVFLVAFAAGCDDDPATPPAPAKSTIVIDPFPGSLAAAWTLSGPNDSLFSGAGDSTLTEMTVGDYTLVWGTVAGWTKPGGSFQVLHEDSTLTFNDSYSPENTSGDVLMASFERVYEGMLSEEYEALLHPNFRFILLAETITAWEYADDPLEQDFFDLDMGLQIHRNIFGQSTGLDPVGYPEDPIESIDVLVLDKIGTWMPVEPTNEDFGGQDAYFNRYQILIHFYQSGNRRFEVSQQMDFYIKQVDGFWYLLGQQGYPEFYNLSSESLACGFLLSMYR